MVSVSSVSLDLVSFADVWMRVRTITTQAQTRMTDLASSQVVMGLIQPATFFV
jgi:hypothetical protein